MGLVVDTDVFIHLERGSLPPDWRTYAGDYGGVYISAVTVSELLVGVYRADTQERRVKRTALVESVLARVSVLPFTAEVARLHAQLLTDLVGRGQKIGAHDLIIAATALYHGFPVLTNNVRDFERVTGLDVLVYTVEENS